MKTKVLWTCFGLMLSTVLTGSATAEIVTANFNAPFDSTNGITAGEVGQSFTTGNASQYNGISIGIFTVASDPDSGIPASNPQAMGTLFLIRGAQNEYLGSAADLSSSTPGYLAQSQSISLGVWEFDNGVTLNGNTQYWFYTQGYTSIIPAIGFASPGGPYAGGNNYYGGNGTTDEYSDDLTQDIDLGFTVNGTTIPEPNTFTLFALAVATFCVRRKRF